uniref:Uncharacterized protein n=1 Tax=Tanacetum cinerariifolium TaxID=118510 RepID=A0A6L2KCI2_TANCI|nr:hypothetical protein [Tanacetum cinerariifolium]
MLCRATDVYNYQNENDIGDVIMAALEMTRATSHALGTLLGRYGFDDDRTKQEVTSHFITFMSPGKFDIALVLLRFTPPRFKVVS